jgi:hypothetical protein
MQTFLVDGIGYLVTNAKKEGEKLDAKDFQVGIKVFLLKFHKGIYNKPSGYRKVGLYTVEEITKRMIRLRKVDGGRYIETVSIIDLRQRLYRLQMEGGTEVKFKPMVDVKRLEMEERVEGSKEVKKIKREENKIMEKLTKEIVKKMTAEGMTVREIAEQFVETYPAMKLSMIMAKVTMLLSGKRPGKQKKEKAVEGRSIPGVECETNGLPAKGEQLNRDMPPVKAESGNTCEKCVYGIGTGNEYTCHEGNNFLPVGRKTPACDKFISVDEQSEVNSHEEHVEAKILKELNIQKELNVPEAAAQFFEENKDQLKKQYNGFIKTFLEPSVSPAETEDKLSHDVDEMMEMVPERKGDFLGTFTGKRFFPIDPKPEEVSIEDIAQSLSKICRFNGHTKRFYSVAEHSLNVERLLRKQGCNKIVRLYGLLHDAAEAYCCDIPRPLKRILYGYDQIENGIMQAIYTAFELPEPNEFQKQLISLADNYILAVESRELMSNTDKWHLVEVDKSETLTKWDEICIRYMSDVRYLLEQVKVKETA